MRFAHVRITNSRKAAVAFWSCFRCWRICFYYSKCWNSIAVITDAALFHLLTQFQPLLLILMLKTVAAIATVAVEHLVLHLCNCCSWAADATLVQLLQLRRWCCTCATVATLRWLQMTLSCCNCCFDVFSPVNGCQVAAVDWCRS